MQRMRKIVEVLDDISVNHKPGKKTVQKLLYLMERRGVQLDLDYRIHFFGPYSSTLDNILRALHNSEVIDINTTGQTHTISVKDLSLCEGEGLSPAENEFVQFVIDKFGDKTALELEAITTLDFVARSLSESTVITDDSEIIKNVQKIKGNKFSEPQLIEHLNLLKQLKYLS
jgi:uncharacterized protein YwgA